MSEHAPLSPSAARRWYECPGSVWLSAKVPAPPASPAASEGTLAHWVAERCLKEGLSPHDYVGTDLDSNIDWTTERANYLDTYIEWARSEIEEGDQYWVEERVGIPALHKDLWGTADLIRWRPRSGELLVADLKFGQNRVEAYRNPQLLIYLLGAYEKLSRPQVRVYRVAIMQPKLDPSLSEWTLTKEELVREARLLAEAVKRVEEHPRTYRPGSYCQWCPAAMACPALRKETMALAPVSPEGPALPAPSELTNEQLVRIIRVAPAVTSYLERVRAWAREELQRGATIPGLRLAQGRSRRSWSDRQRAVELLVKEHGLSPEDVLELASPAKVEKLLGRKTLRELEEEGVVLREEGTPIVKPE